VSFIVSSNPNYRRPLSDVRLPLGDFCSLAFPIRSFSFVYGYYHPQSHKNLFLYHFLPKKKIVVFFFCWSLRLSFFFTCFCSLLCFLGLFSQNMLFYPLYPNYLSCLPFDLAYNGIISFLMVVQPLGRLLGLNGH
jgi:hypothetical protein